MSSNIRLLQFKHLFNYNKYNFEKHNIIMNKLTAHSVFEYTRYISNHCYHQMEVCSHCGTTPYMLNSIPSISHHQGKGILDKLIWYNYIDRC